MPRIPLASVRPGYFRHAVVNQGPLRLENPAETFSLQFEPHDSILQEYLTRVGFFGLGFFSLFGGVCVCLFVLGFVWLFCFFLIKKYRQRSD